LNKFIRDKQPPEVLKNIDDDSPQKFSGSENDKAPVLLEFFVKDARKAVEFLKDFCQTNDYSDKSLIDTFTITVHGIRGALTNIGEVVLAGLALELETAGRERNFSFIESSAPELLRELSSLLEKYEPKHEDDGVDNHVEFLLEKLSSICELCADYDRKGVMKEVAEIHELSEISSETRKVISKIKGNVAYSEFEAAEKAATDYISVLTALETKRGIVVSLKKGIGGIDIDKGINRYGGDVDTYLKILRSYAVNANSMLKSMKFVINSELKDYEITVHGFKGMSFDIFASELGQKAKALEFAAKDGEIEYINKHNQRFLEAARELVDEIEGTLTDINIHIDAQNPKVEKCLPDSRLLTKLMEACKTYDMDGVDMAIEEIEAYKYTDDDGLVEWLRGCVDTMEYDEIVEKLNNSKE
jgi:HPt (histidine-containing phosphotransfer) domain-containing protein